MVKKILLVLLAVVAAFLLFVATRPAQYRIERSAVVRAPAAVAYGKVVDFRNWPGWSPWAHLDPNMKVDYAGPESGPGSVYHWKGNDKVGEGRMTITGAKPAEEIDIRLEFIKPWEQTSQTVFTFRPDGAGGTKVTWSMSGDRDFVGKLFGVFMDMDGMVGPDFEKGLAALKKLAEGGS
jgi:hypothetical protein